MNDSVGGKALNIVLAAIGLFFLFMGFTDIGQDPFGVMLGFSAGLPLLGLFVWRKIRSSQGRFVRAGAGCIVLFVFALFFLSMGFTGLVGERRTAIMGFCLGLPLAALYVFLRRGELRAAEQERAEEYRARPVRTPVAPPAAPRTPTRAEPALSLCPHCGAPSKDKVCPYCGMTK